MNYANFNATKQNYLTALNQLTPKLVAALKAKKIHKRYLVFGSVGEAPAKKPYVPNNANSEFLANREMGDWAEESLKSALHAADTTISVSHYGDTGSMIAGAPGFKEMYLAGLEETRIRGKRPDLLVFPKTLNVQPDLTTLPDAQRTHLAKQSIGAIEVRSSKFDALTYIAARKAEREAGKKGARDTPNFTVKIEDLKIVYRWIKNFEVPQIYAQVFFDSIFAINFLTIISAIIEGEFVIEKPAKSQEKATIMIPITVGKKIGSATSNPQFTAVHNVTRLGRHDAYVKPIDGGFTINSAELEHCLYKWDFAPQTTQQLLGL